MSDKIDNIETELDIELDEETASAATLHPKSGSGGGESKAQTLATFTKMLSDLGKEDLTDLFNRTIEAIGTEAKEIPDGAAVKNKASISAKVVKEDLDEIFPEELSEEFRDQASVIFEAAVATRINLETVRLEEEFETKLDEQVTGIYEAITDDLNKYLDYCVGTFMEDNAVAIESNIRTELSENFINGLHRLFTESYITVPESKIDILGEMKAEILSLKDQVNTLFTENAELSEAIEESVKSDIVHSLVEGLTDSEAEKLINISESIDYSDMDNFKGKLEVIKETYFNNSKEVNPSTGLITETIDGDFGEEITQEINEELDPRMESYIKTLSKSNI